MLRALNLPTRRLTLPAIRAGWPSLRLAVGGLGVAIVVVMAVLVAEVVAEHMRRTAAEAAIHNVETMVRGYIDPEVDEADLALGAAHNDLITLELSRIIVAGDIRQISIWSRDGRIAYSTRPQLRGERFSVNEVLARAFAGASVASYRHGPSSEAWLPADNTIQHYLDIVVPIRGSTDGNPIGVYTAHQDARPIERHVDATKRDVFVIALAAASLILVLLIVAFAGVSARLSRQNQLLRERNAKEKLLTEDMRRSEERFRSLVRNSTDVVLICDAQGTIAYESEAVERVLGYRPAERIGKSGFDSIHPADIEWTRQMLAEVAARPGVDAEAEFRARHADGSWRWMQGTAKNLLDDPAVRGIVVNYRDITERRSLEDQLRYQAFHDTLTGLPNRALLIDRLEHAITRARRDDPALAVLFLDLDDFKSVNDSLGHPAGDELLVGVAERLRRTLREADTAARMGGDEFAIVLEDARDLDAPVEVATRVLAALRDPFVVQGRSVRISGSVGIAVYAGPEHTADELLRHADVAMYAAKTQGKDRFTVFELEIHHAAIDRHQLKSDLHSALARSQFSLVYQPLIELGSDRISGVEALVRWRHPLRGLMGPMDFIPLAEETGVIVPLGRWVLNEACRAASSWQSATGRPLKVSVNLSARQIDDSRLVEDVAAALSNASLPPELLVLEITESVLVADVESVVNRLTELKALGVQLAIDDFGTGYSSLSYLRRLPVSVLKIDRSFIAAVNSGHAEGALVRSIVSIAQILELRTVAEGIEEVAQLEMLRGLGVTEGQGFLFAQPLDERGLTELLKGARSARRAGKRAPHPSPSLT